jgi:hypothetical protein
VYPDRIDLIETDDALIQVGARLRRYHDAVLVLDFAGDLRWTRFGGHGDLTIMLTEGR